MEKIILIILFLQFMTGCDTENPSGDTRDAPMETAEQPVIAASDTTPRVTGIGGIFFQSKDPKATMDWYGENLGLAIDDFGSPFEFRNANRPDEINYLRWSPFEEGATFLGPSDKAFMINYRVQNIEGLVAKLRINGVTILDSIVAYDYGKFIHIMDHEGNKIELWEPQDDFLSQLGGKTTK